VSPSVQTRSNLKARFDLFDLLRTLKIHSSNPPAQPEKNFSQIENKWVNPTPPPEPVKPVNEPPAPPQHTNPSSPQTTTTTTTQTASNGSVSYFGTPVRNKSIGTTTSSPGYTTPGYEWATRDKGYDWDFRREIYGGNVLLGEAYERSMRQGREDVESNYKKMERQREDAIKVNRTGVRTMIASGYNAGMEA
jgi:hypothetical protein